MRGQHYFRVDWLRPAARALDPPGHRELTRILASLSQARIIVTHDVHFARALTGRAVFFEKGKISADGPLEEIVRRFSWNAGV